MIYFDNSATTKPYREILDSFTKVSLDYFGNPSSLHNLGVQAENLLSRARNQTAELLNVKPAEILFTSGGTESNNLAIKGTAMKYRSRGKHIITTNIEHASVYAAMEQLAELGFEISYVKVNSKGIIELENLEKAIRPDTILVSVIHVNNEVGTVQPIKEISRLLEEHPKVMFHVDHVQGVAKVPLDLHDCRIDFCSFSGHKFHGLKGTGALYMREGVSISPLLSGGSQELRVRSGTENVAGMVAMSKALRFSLEKHQQQLPNMLKIHDYLRKELSNITGVTIHTPNEQIAPHILNFSVKGFKAEVFVHFLEQKGIFISTTSACSSKKKAISKTLLAMGIPDEVAESAVRVSLSYESTMQEAETFIAAVSIAIKQLGEVMK
ncbi:cysteine desulfurase family protein [Mesobacillus harenae]|uniref:cysteine desulfurase family protein n=1 Tax=Mesobacillus harenae TaxID=2213203 RepID=UPI0015800F22|nr:cysteine desulfurase family protein [Mesobacillus harenae]